jgi:uncharacterized Zn finger protein (UPF0148 family)
MSMTGSGFCFICGSSVDTDISDHVTQEHERVASKPQTAIKSWQNRLEDIVQSIEEIRQEDDITVQIWRLDTEVIQELYLVRAKLSQTRRRNAATTKG